MADERHYRDEEIRRIFELASSELESPGRPGGTADSLTLGELQDIGREVGIPADRIAQAARSIDLPAPVEDRQWPLGIRLAVRRTVTLPRAPTQHEWDVLVSEIRQTFDARGRVSVYGGIHAWSNGNLHIYIEPVVGGYRLRMGTRKGNALATGMAGIIGIGWGAAAFAGLSLTGDLAQGFLAPTIASLLGVGSLASTLVRLPSWARTRGAQMDYIAARARALIGEPAVE